MVRRVRAQTKPVQAQKGQIQKSKKNKRLKVQKGDVIQLGSSYHMWTHTFGAVGRVIEVLDKDRLICVGLAPGDPDFEGLQLIVLTRRPKKQPQTDYLPWASQVISVRERIVYKEIEVKPKRLVTSHEQLAEVLADSDDSEHVVVQIPPRKIAQAQTGHPSANKP
jgi:hypothetical protein